MPELAAESHTKKKAIDRKKMQVVRYGIPCWTLLFSVEKVGKNNIAFLFINPNKSLVYAYKKKPWCLCVRACVCRVRIEEHSFFDIF